MGKTLLLLGLWLSLCLTTLGATASGFLRPATDFPLPADSYGDQQIPSLFGKLTGRIQREPLNLVASIIFFAAIIHTFLTAQFRKIAYRYQKRYEAIEDLLHAKDGPPDLGKKRDKLIFRAQLFYFMGEVESVFGIWLIPLFIAIIAFHGWSTMVDYVGNVNVADAIFVVVIMTMASSLPIIRFTETVIARVSAIGKGTPASWWLAILTLGPLLGSFITGPAAMTICALLLRHRFYSLKPSERLKYATLGPAVRQHLPRRGIDPVCISAGCDRREHLEMGPGVHANPFRLESCHRDHLVQFAVPYVFRRESPGLNPTFQTKSKIKKCAGQFPGIHFLFLCWTVANAHYPVLVILGLLFFLAFGSATRLNQHAIALRSPLLVGFFLAALITDEVYFDRVSQIQMDTWSQGRVGLIGDAAFCPSLLAGQGAALAMTAAYVLAGELAQTGGAPQQ